MRIESNFTVKIKLKVWISHLLTIFPKKENKKSLKKSQCDFFIFLNFYSLNKKNKYIENELMK